MIQEVYVRYVREIILHVYKEGVDLPDWKKNQRNRKIKKNVIYDTYTMLCRSKTKIKILRSTNYCIF